MNTVNAQDAECEVSCAASRVGKALQTAACSLLAAAELSVHMPSLVLEQLNFCSIASNVFAALKPDLVSHIKQKSSSLLETGQDFVT